MKDDPEAFALFEKRAREYAAVLAEAKNLAQCRTGAASPVLQEKKLNQYGADLKTLGKLLDMTPAELKSQRERFGIPHEPVET